MIKKIVIAAILILIILGVIFYINRNKTNTPAKPTTGTDQSSEAPKIVSTKPDPLENTIVSANEIVEITFNKPLQNPGEFKLRIEPKIDYKVELSGDRKTAKIIPSKGYALSTTYTIFIGPDAKFDGSGSWGQEKIYHYRTITYRGV